MNMCFRKKHCNDLSNKLDPTQVKLLWIQYFYTYFKIIITVHFISKAYITNAYCKLWEQIKFDIKKTSKQKVEMLDRQSPNPFVDRKMISRLTTWSKAAPPPSFRGSSLGACDSLDNLDCKKKKIYKMLK